MRGTARQGVLFNFLLTGALILPLVVFDRQLLALFLPPASQALEIARHLNHVVIGSFLFFGVSFVISGVVRSTGAVIPPLLILAGSLWGVRVPFAELLQPYWGADAIWWSFPVSSLVSMLLSLAYYRWGGWRKAKMMGKPSHAEALATPSEIPACPPSPVADRMRHWSQRRHVEVVRTVGPHRPVSRAWARLYRTVSASSSPR